MGNAEYMGEIGDYKSSLILYQPKFGDSCNMFRKIGSIAITIAALSCLTAQAGIKDVDLKKGLVMYMSFDEGTGKSVADTSTNELKVLSKGMLSGSRVNLAKLFNFLHPLI